MRGNRQQSPGFDPQRSPKPAARGVVRCFKAMFSPRAVAHEILLVVPFSSREIALASGLSRKLEQPSQHVTLREVPV
jgi:hypothetical protein